MAQYVIKKVKNGNFVIKFEYMAGKSRVWTTSDISEATKGDLAMTSAIVNLLNFSGDVHEIIELKETK